MKKVLVLFLSAVMLLSTCILSASALSFTDISEGHWAWANVQALVNDGTVSGYEDGSFRPSGTVTRAEFVKMLGKSSVVRESGYSDVASEHWAYDYIMHANFPEDGTNLFQPNAPITRGLVAELLWIRGGKKNDTFVPSIITSQYAKNPAAAAWVYTTGLIRGDGDGINLRLDSTLSRAEAATLIVRSRTASQTADKFENIVNPDIIKAVYNGLNLFDGAPYAPDTTLKNSQVARAALRIGSEQNNLTYASATVESLFDHPYAKDVSIVFNALGLKNIDAAFADKTATFGNTVAALSYQFILKAHKGQSYGAKTEGLPADVTSMMNTCLTFAKDKGIISLKEDLNKPVTVRDFTLLCLLFDSVIGTQTAITTDSHPATTFAKYDNSLLLIPEGYGDFRVMVKDIPLALYTIPFNGIASTPAENYDFAREFSSLFMSIVSHMKSSVMDKATLRLTYYPSMVVKTNEGYTMRLKCDVTSMAGSKTVAELFPVREGIAGADLVLSQGSQIYIDLATGSNISSVNMTSETAYVDQVIALN